MKQDSVTMLDKDVLKFLQKNIRDYKTFIPHAFASAKRALALAAIDLWPKEAFLLGDKLKEFGEKLEDIRKEYKKPPKDENGWDLHPWEQTHYSLSFLAREMQQCIKESEASAGLTHATRARLFEIAANIACLSCMVDELGSAVNGAEERKERIRAGKVA